MLCKILTAEQAAALNAASDSNPHFLLRAFPLADGTFAVPADVAADPKYDPDKLTALAGFPQREVADTEWQRAAGPA